MKGSGGRSRPSSRGSLRLRGLLARPAPREPRESAARLMVDGGAHGAEDRALEGGGQEDLAEADVAMLGLRRLLVVDDSPRLLEDLLAQEPGDQAADDAEWDEQELHARGTL